jgi:hypothetical protein
MKDASRETPDQARTRRRWIGLAELVAVAGLVIAALGAWNNWSERREATADKTASAAAEARANARADLSATVEDDGRRLLLKDARHDLQSVSISFPRALGAPRQEPVGDPVIDVKGIEAPLLKLTDGGPDTREGRLPVLVTARWLDGDEQRRATDIHDLIWKTEGRVLRGRALRLEGLRLRRRGGTQAMLDRLWKAP